MKETKMVITNWNAKELNIKQDSFRKIVEIEGIKYSYDFFRNMAGIGECGFGLNKPFKIIERKDGTITAENVEQ